MKKQLTRMLFAAAALLAPSVWAATYWAAPDGTADAACTEAEPGTIVAALAKCVARTSFEEGDAVMLKSGTYDFTGVACANNMYASLIPVKKNFVTIRSESDNPEECIFRGWGAVVTQTELKDDDGNVTNTVTTTTFNRQRCFAVTGPALIRGIRFENFITPSGNAGIFKATANTAGILEVENCIATRISSDSQYIAGAFCDGGTFRDCTIVDNVETNCENGSLCRMPTVPTRFERCSFLRNSGKYALLSGSNITLVDCLFKDNFAPGICCLDVGLVQNCSFLTNQARCIQSSSKSATIVTRIDGCTFAGNTVNNSTGVGVAAANCTAVLVTNSRFEENHTISPVTDTRYCGAIAGYYGAYSNCVFKGNWGDNLRGGGGTVRYATLQNCTIEGNDSKTDANSTSIGLMDCIAINCLIKDNKQQNGKPVNYGNTLLNCTVVGSVTTSAAVQGGAATNTIVYGTSSGVDIDTGDYSHVLYGTSSDAGTLTDCAQLAEDPFSGDAKPETPYLPKRKSGALDAGILLAEVGSVDYYGNKRLSGGVLDIGCAEYPLVPGTTILLR